MRLWLVVPVKSLRDGKSRLAPALSVAERRAFNEWLLVRTLRQAALFPGLERTLLVSACEEACACASAQGAQVLKERTPGGLNEALRQAQRSLSELGATRMLAVSSDLPLLRAQDLRQLAGAVSAHTIALAPDRDWQGTNGLCLDASVPFDFAFGPNSFARHLNGTAQLGLDPAVVERAGLAFDVDTPDHLRELHAWHGHSSPSPPTRRSSFPARTA
jgi:2-phospho-L-lactate guanylyltransferase